MFREIVLLSFLEDSVGVFAILAEFWVGVSNCFPSSWVPGYVHAPTRELAASGMGTTVSQDRGTPLRRLQRWKDFLFLHCSSSRVISLNTRTVLWMRSLVIQVHIKGGIICSTCAYRNGECAMCGKAQSPHRVSQCKLRYFRLDCFCC